MKNRKQKEDGFIALVSVLLISGILLASVIEGSYGSYTEAFNVLRSQNKEESYELARSCLEIVTLRLTENPNYQPIMSGDYISVGNNRCSINYPITYNNGTWSAETSSSIASSTTNLLGNFASNNGVFSIKSIREIP